jgi:hypothetical protein
MATNVYFNHFPKNVTSEQLLIEDLVIEAIKIYGMDVYYLPRSSRDEVDYLFGEDPIKQYTSAYPIELYLENVTGMDGEQDFISKFGLEIRDEIGLLMARRRFKQVVPMTRPLEGDLIYVPLVTSFFEIMHVEHENDQAMFFTLGRGRAANVYVYALKLKQYVFSNEIVNTGVKEIDDNIRNYYPKTRISLTSGSGKFVNDEIVYQGTSLSSAAAQAIVFDFVPNSHIDIIRVQGSFTSGNVKGNTSSAQWIINTISDTSTMNTAFEDIIDNARIESEADGIMDWTETNPFGGD